MNTGKIISLEGISGCGKTYFLGHLKKCFPNDSYIDEVSERTGALLDSKIIDALNCSGDAFFRNGLPMTETLLLLGLKTYDYEHRISHALEEGKTVWEDRSVDTIAVYQTILLHPRDETKWTDKALRLLDLASKFRKIPDQTILLHDDFEATIKRAEIRRNIAYTEDERALLMAAHTLYLKIAAMNKQRLILVDRRETNEESIKKILSTTRSGNHIGL